MSSPQHCLAMAEEADRLARIVSYERDRTRLRSQAAAWRQMAGALQPPVSAAVAEPRPEPVDTPQATGWANWLRKRRRA